MDRSHPARAARATGIAILAVLSLTVPALAQGPAGTFGEVIDVRVINVEAVVTDREGRRVTGLGPDDFRLRVDGAERPIDYFTEVREGRAVEPEEGAPATVAGLEAGEPVGTRYLVFIDDYLTLARDRDRLLERVRSDLAELGPADEVAVVAFDGRRLDLLTGWTGSHEELDRVFAAALERRAHGLENDVRRKNILSGRGRAGVGRMMFAPGPNRDPYRDPSNRFGRASPEQEEWAYELSRWMEVEVAAVTAALRSLSSAPGRKVAILLTGSWAFDPVASAAGDNRMPSRELGLERGEDLYEALVETANLLGFTLYPVRAGSPFPTGGSSSTFRHLASRTGGRALLYGPDTEALEKVVQDTRSYYWLGFTAERAGDDRSRRIELEPLRPGLEVRTRQGYLDFSREAEVTAAVESLLLFDHAGGIGAHPLPVRLGAAERSGRHEVDLPITVGIPVDLITMLPTGGSWVAELELRGAVIDAEGNRSEIPVIPLHLEAESEPSPGGLARYDTSLTLRRIEQEVVLSVFDPLSGNLLAIRMGIDPKALLESR